MEIPSVSIFEWLIPTKSLFVLQIVTEITANYDTKYPIRIGLPGALALDSNEHIFYDIHSLHIHER